MLHYLQREKEVLLNNNHHVLIKCIREPHVAHLNWIKNQFEAFEKATRIKAVDL